MLSDKIKKHYEYGYITILLLLPILAFSGYRITEMESAYDEWRILEVIQLALLLLFFSINRNIYDYAKIKISSPIFYLFFALVITLFISSLISDNYLRSLRDNTLLISLFLAALPITYILEKKNHTQNKLIIFISLAHIIFLINISAQFLSAYSIKDTSIFTSWYSSFSNPRIYGDFLIIILPLIFSTTINSNKNQKTLIIYTVLSHFLLFFSGGRAEILSLFLSVIIVYLINPYQREHVKKYILVICVSLICNFIVQAMLPSDLNNFTRSDFSSGRIDIYLKTLPLLSGHWIWGTGGDSFYKIPGINDLVVAHPHNLPLQILFEYGIIVFLIIILIFFILSHIWLKKITQLTKTDNSNINYLYLSIALLASIINCLFSGNHVYPLSQLYILFIISLLASYHPHSKIEKIAPSVFTLTIIRLSLIIYTGIFLTINYQSLSCYQLKPKNNIIIENIPPRFWSSSNDNFEKSCYNSISK